MSNTDIHKNQALHNISFLKSFLNKSTYRDWQVIVAFYTALHIMDCELNKKNMKWREGRLQLNSSPGMHAWRESCIQRSFSSEIFRSYKVLHERSKTARYLESMAGDKIAIDELTDQIVKELINKYLKKILDEFGYSIT